jgi:hypothetical protein
MICAAYFHMWKLLALLENRVLRKSLAILPCILTLETQLLALGLACVRNFKKMWEAGARLPQENMPELCSRYHCGVLSMRRQRRPRPARFWPGRCQRRWSSCGMCFWRLLTLAAGRCACGVEQHGIAGAGSQGGGLCRWGSRGQHWLQSFQSCCWGEGGFQPGTGMDEVAGIDAEPGGWA